MPFWAARRPKEPLSSSSASVIRLSYSARSTCCRKPEEASGAKSELPEGMTAILFLDIADSTALTSKLGDAAYRDKERELDAGLRAAITEAGGTPVEGKLTGDGALLRHLDVLLTQETGIPCHIADNALEGTATGSGVALEHMEVIKRSLPTEEESLVASA